MKKENYRKYSELRSRTLIVCFELMSISNNVLVLIVKSETMELNNNI